MIAQVERNIIVADPGVDDVFALLVAAGIDEKVSFVSTYGNAEESLTAKNLKGTTDFISTNLEYRGEFEIEVFRGADRAVGVEVPYEPEGGDLFWIHGPNACEGLFQDATPSDITSDELYDRLAKDGKEVGVISVAAVTEVAHLLSRQDAPNVTELTIMGGVIFSQGNVTPHVEANFSHDPQALATVFEEVKNRSIDMLLVPLDLTQHPGLELTPERLDEMMQQLKGHGGEQIATLLDALFGEKSTYRGFYNSKRSVRLPQTGEERIFQGPVLHDLTAVLARRHPEIFRVVPMKLLVRPDGAIDAPTSWMGEYESAYDIHVATDVLDPDQYWALTTHYLASYK